MDDDAKKAVGELSAALKPVFAAAYARGADDALSFAANSFREAAAMSGSPVMRIAGEEFSKVLDDARKRIVDRIAKEMAT